MNISERQDRLLDFIIREYVKTAKPIPSALVCRKSRLNVSPATVRNEMNYLEEMGLLSQLHTSGGRVPTDSAYRYFVNQILSHENPRPVERDQQFIKQALTKAGNDPRVINKVIAQAISELSENLVITSIDQATNRRVDEHRDFFKVGLASLFEMPEFREFDRMFQLTSFFEEFDQMFQSIEKQFFGSAPVARQVNVIIGHENPFQQVHGETVIVARYPLPGNCIGSLTLIGPTRMDYEKNISLIKYTADELKRRASRI